MPTPTDTTTHGAHDEYIFRTTDEELVRLGYQHRAFGAPAYDIWERAGFAPGSRILELGCGPGYTTIDLAHLVGPTGEVLAVDESQKFLDHLDAKMAIEPLANVRTSRANVAEFDAPPARFDGAYARWLMCFLPDPAPAVARVAAALKPGGVFAVQDYCNYKAIDLVPRSRAFRAIIDAVGASWREHGGDPDVCAALPAVLADAGFDLREMTPIVRTARPGSALWRWPEVFFKSFGPVLVTEGHLQQPTLDEFWRDWAERSASAHAVFTTPPMMDIIAVKR